MLSWNYDGARDAGPIPARLSRCNSDPCKSPVGAFSCFSQG